MIYKRHKLWYMSVFVCVCVCVCVCVSVWAHVSRIGGFGESRL